MYGHRLQIWPRDSWHPGYISLVNSLSHSLGWLFLHYLLSPLPSSSFSSDDFAFGHQSEQNFHILPSPHLLSYLCLSPQTCFLTCYKWNAPAGLLPKARAPTPALDSIYIPSQPPRSSAPVSPFPPPPPASWILPFGSPTCRNFSLLKKTLPYCMTFSSPHPFFWPLMVTAPILSQPRAPLSVSWAHPHGWDCSGQGQKLAFLLPIQVSFSPYTSGSLGSNGCSCSSRNGFIQRFHAELTSWSFSSPVAPPSPSQSLHVEVHVHCMPSLI